MKHELNAPQNPARRDFLKKMTATGMAAVFGVTGSVLGQSKEQIGNKEFMDKDGNCECVGIDERIDMAFLKIKHEGYQEVNRILQSGSHKVLNPSVDLQIIIKDGKKLFRFAFNCRIVQTQNNDAYRRFGVSRVDYGYAKTLIEAKEQIDESLKNSEEKIKELAGNYRTSRILFPEGFIRESFVGDMDANGKVDGFWYFKQLFFIDNSGRIIPDFY